MKTEFNPLEALADISEDELNEFIELQEEAPKKRRRQKTRESFVCFISFYVNSQKYDRKVESNWGGKDGDEKADNDGT